ncbi:MAG: prolyl oligopeptidase, partial [Candidatus Azotimanducaceae bacterium]
STIFLTTATDVVSMGEMPRPIERLQPSDEQTSNITDTDNMQNVTDIDPYLWLEEVEGEAALAWVREQNQRSLLNIQKHSAYDANFAAAIALANSQQRIPYGAIRDGMVYNFWQDAANVRGLWRRATLNSYQSDEPAWEIVLDVDQLSDNEGKNWVYKGVTCLQRNGIKVTRCMMALSDGGKDAVVNREFDLTTKAFVEAGFVTTEAKQELAWIDQDTLLVATDWGNDGTTLTESGYPFSARLWKRGQTLSEAQEVYKAQASDVGVWPWVTELTTGEVVYGAIKAETFFTSSYWRLGDGEPLQFPVPLKCSLGAVFDGQQLVTLQQDWALTDQDKTFRTGDLVSFNLQEFLNTRQLPCVELVFRANDRQAVNNVSIAGTTALLSINDNVVSKLLRLKHSEAGWTNHSIDLPGTGQARVIFANRHTDTAFINYEDFLTPDSLLMFDTLTNSVSHVKSLPPKFNADGLVVHQKQTTSKDGTQVPFFVIHHKDIKLDSSTPTLLYGYGGFEVSMNPSYSGGIGRLWLEKGGVYVLANIRGGGEFGPTWHQAGLKGNRQRIYDDFIAVGEALIDLKITSPKHLGIMGGSNGGLLMGVMLNQRPDLWNAVVIQVPLLDMLRYHKLLAGASWVDEYGDPDVPAERTFLETISPYQNFDASKDYPTPYFVTSTKDDRVHPGHARKMAKLFEAAGKPFLYYENIDGGHSAAANQEERAKRTALEFTYLTDRLFGD